MEGNECYKFSTIRNYLKRSGGAPVRTALDVGCNLGHMALLMREYFPGSLVIAFEPVLEYYEQACRSVQADSWIKVFNCAVTGAHRYGNDVGDLPLPANAPLIMHQALPASGPGWIGGSTILREGERPEKAGYAAAPLTCPAITLDDAVEGACRLCAVQVIDYVKFDCEGCENSAIGCASIDTLRRIRYLSGEYHDIGRFVRVTSAKLSATHRVNLVGGDWGSFFAERKQPDEGILRVSADGQLRLQGRHQNGIISFHHFNAAVVDAEALAAHGL